MGQAAPVLPGDEETLVFNPGHQLPKLNFNGEKEDAFLPVLVIQDGDVRCPGRYIVTDHCLLVEFLEDHEIRYEVEEAGWITKRCIESRLFLLPSIQCHLSERSFGTMLKVAGCWPVFGMSLVFLFREEAEDVSRRLLVNAQALILAAHGYEPDGAPPLTLTSLHTRPGPPEEQKGRFLAGGYVLCTDIPDRDNRDIRYSVRIFPPPPKYRMCWSELCGPDKTGYIKMYLYNSHDPDCMFLSSYVWPKPGEEEAFMSFRSEQMAEMWRDLALETYETGELRADLFRAARAEAVNDGVRELMQNARHLDFLRPV